MSSNTLQVQLPRALLALRLGVFIVMFMWTIEKFVNPRHATGIFANFYGVEGLEEGIIYAFAIVELLIVLAFLAGLYKRLTYGAILFFHGATTLISWQYYLGFSNMLFFAAWPMFAACYALYILREQDTLLTLKLRKKSA